MIRSVGKATCVVVVLALGACTRTEQPTPDPKQSPDTGTGAGITVPDPVLRFSPHDLQTSTGTTPLRIIVGAENINYPPKISDQDLANLVSKASLETYPGGAKVATATDYTKATATKTGMNGLTAVVLHPTAPLTNQWYAMRLADLPAGVVILAGAGIVGGMSKDPNGDLVARFHPGVQPVIAGIQVSGSAGSPPDVIYIDFSENVDFTAPAADLFRFEQGGKSLPFDADPAMVSMPHQHFQFSSPLSETLPLTIHIKPGIVSSDPSKVPLGFPAGKPLAPITFVLSQLAGGGGAPGVGAAYFWLPPL